ncbi:hypothetical protein RJ55_04050 [Drechmeria coniospora]|nr:hypothetical protein RJ55_04050 [Drechmeria coniospora]
MAFGTLYTVADDNPRSIGIKVAAAASKLDLEFEYIDLGKPTKRHLDANGLGKFPAFVGTDGFALSECIAIAIYIASQREDTPLLGKTRQDYASIVRWMSFFNYDIAPALTGWFQPLVGWMPYHKASVDASSNAVLRAVRTVDTHLTDRTYLVGDRITLADYVCAGLLLRGFQHFFDRKWRQENPNVTRWYETITNQPDFLAAAKKVDFLDRRLLFKPPSQRD